MMFTVTLVINSLHNGIISGNKYEGKGGSSYGDDRWWPRLGTTESWVLCESACVQIDWCRHNMKTNLMCFCFSPVGTEPTSCWSELWLARLLADMVAWGKCSCSARLVKLLFFQKRYFLILGEFSALWGEPERVAWSISVVYVVLTDDDQD